MRRTSHQLTGRIVAALALLGASACTAPQSSAPVFHAKTNPELLSQWQMLSIKDQKLALNETVTPYDLNSALFSDYAHKLRTVWMPQGKAASYNGDTTFDFPVGTVITKTFYYERAKGSNGQDGLVLQNVDNTSQLLRTGFDLTQIRLVETRVLVRRDEGWVALPYVWNESQTDAELKRTGDIKQLTLVGADLSQKPFSYVVPNTNQCSGCHATDAVTREIKPIGPKARHLNTTFNYQTGPQNQLSAWQAQGRLIGLPDVSKIPQNVRWDDTNAAINLRARAYLDINCSHCHNKNGAANTSGLLLEPDSPEGLSLGTCKLPIAAGTGTGDRKFGIVPGKPDQSIFTYRIASTDPQSMMPELGRALAHDEGLALIAKWIEEMPGACT